MANKGSFVKGKVGGPGRPKGSSGRTQALAVIDSILINGKERLRKEFKAAFEKDPIDFWEKYGQPLLPKEAILDVNLEQAGENEILIQLDEKLSGLSVKVLEALAYPNKAGKGHTSAKK